MTAYEKICAEACECCAKGNQSLVSAVPGMRLHYWGGAPDSAVCTAPSRDEVIERLMAELAESNRQKDTATAHRDSGDVVLDQATARAEAAEADLTTLKLERDESERLRKLAEYERDLAIDAARAAGQDSGTVDNPSKHSNEKTTTFPAPCHIEP